MSGWNFNLPNANGSNPNPSYSYNPEIVANSRRSYQSVYGDIPAGYGSGYSIGFGTNQTTSNSYNPAASYGFNTGSGEAERSSDTESPCVRRDVTDVNFDPAEYSAGSADNPYLCGFVLPPPTSNEEDDRGNDNFCSEVDSSFVGFTPLSRNFLDRDRTEGTRPV